MKTTAARIPPRDSPFPAIGINRTCAACCTRVMAACARSAAATCLATTEATWNIFGRKGRWKKIQLTAVIDFFRLNRDARLVRERNRLRAAELNALDEGRIEDAKRMAIRFRPHSLVAKQILADRAPQYLPTFEEELRWLLQDALAELLVAVEMQDQAELTDSPQERLTKELLWAFAALWLEPLTGNAAEVESLLQDADLTEIVRPFLDALNSCAAAGRV